MSNNANTNACPLPPRSENERVRDLLRRTRVIAVAGMSPKPSRPSHEVGLYLRDAGYTILPVHPRAESIGGLRVYPSLLALPAEPKIDLVDLFIAGDRTLPFVEEAARIGARAIWFQPGAENPDAANRARELGMEVVSGRCTMSDHMRLM